MILTRKEKIVLTPSYYVFKMYKVHQDAILLPSEIKCEDYQFGEEKVPALNVSASVNKDGIIYISIVNVNPNKNMRLECEIRGAKVSSVSGEILTAKEINAFNDFDRNERVFPVKFSGAKTKGEKLIIDVPAKSVIILELN